MHIMLREGSLTKNLKDLIPVITPDNISRCFFVTDDRHPKDILEEGHIDFMVRTTVAAGIKPVSAFRLATMNCAEYFKLDKLGALAPGFVADILVMDSLEKVNVEMVFKRGKLVAKDGQLLDLGVVPPKVTLRSSVNVKFLEADDFKIKATGKRIRAIEILPKEIKTHEVITDTRQGSKTVSP
jgi:adenine deaminase